MIGDYSPSLIEAMPLGRLISAVRLIQHSQEHSQQSRANCLLHPAVNSYSAIIQEQSQTIQSKAGNTKGWMAVVVYTH